MSLVSSSPDVAIRTDLGAWNQQNTVGLALSDTLLHGTKARLGAATDSQLDSESNEVVGDAGSVLPVTVPASEPE